MTDVSIESLILNNLVNSEPYTRKAMPHIKPEYFTGSQRVIYELILDFISKYNKLPNSSVLDIEFQKSNAAVRPDRHEILQAIHDFATPQPAEHDWLVDSTEKWCKDRAVHLAVMEAISIIDGKSADKAEGAIPEILNKALSVTFDTNVGHDYLENADRRFDFYHHVEDKIEFDLDMFNQITNGGVPRKTLNIILAGCVHPDTKIVVRITSLAVEKEIKIGEVKALLENGYTLEVSSPDGWVKISDFIDKGQWDEYSFSCNDKNISCNENHLFQSTLGWMSAKDIFNAQEVTLSKLHFFCDTGRYEPGTVIKTGKKIPIVDIHVEHNNNRYYTNGISSHNTGVGKSLGMCHLAAADLSMGRDVLYITMEMAEERIAERIDANLLDVRIDELKNLSQATFSSKIKNLSDRTKGKIVIKEYPTASAHVGHFRALLHELKLKKKFTPDVIYIDYLNICASSRIKGLSGSVNTYSLIKAIAEELRGLAVEFNVPIWSATQTNRNGYCLDPLTIVETEYGNKRLNEIVVGDCIKSNTGFNEVVTVFPKTKKKAYRIMTSSGKTIICSADHKFPVNDIDKSINSGLKIGDSLVTLN
jgi:hypothetical protein